jgi:hypothetical protein
MDLVLSIMIRMDLTRCLRVLSEWLLFYLCVLRVVVEYGLLELRLSILNDIIFEIIYFEII